MSTPLKPATETTGMGLQNAQYNLCGREQAWGPESVVASGLDWPGAKALESRLSVEINRFWPGPHFGAPVFTPSLRIPEYEKNGNVSRGDFVVRSVETTGPRNLGHDGSSVSGTLLVVAIAHAVEEDGLLLREVSGELVKHSGRHWVFPASQFDAAAAEAELMTRWAKHLDHGYFGVPWGFFENAASVAHVLRMHLKPVPTVLPTVADVSRIVGFPVCLDGAGGQPSASELAVPAA